EMLDNAIMRVTRKARYAYFLVGHNEYDFNSDEDNGLSRLAKLLLANNVISKKLELGIKKEIPADCDVLIVAGPRDPLRTDEEKLINDYLERGGDALFLLENIVVTTPDKPLKEDDLDKNPSLNGI